MGILFGVLHPLSLYNVFSGVHGDFILIYIV